MDKSTEDLRSLGFALAGKFKRSLGTPLEQLVVPLVHGLNYDAQVQDNRLWLRHPRRRRGSTPPQLLTRCLAGPIREIRDSTLQTLWEMYRRSIYFKHHEESSIRTSPEEAIAFLDSAEFNISDANAWYLFSSLFAALPPSGVLPVLKKAMGVLAGRNPELEVRAYIGDSTIHEQFSAARVIYGFTDIPVSELQAINCTPAPLRDWHLIEPLGVIGRILAWTGLLPFPHICSLSFGLVGLSICVIGEPIATCEVKAGHREWQSILRWHSDFAQHHVDGPFRERIRNPYTIFRRQIWTQPLSSFPLLFDWIIDAVTKVLFEFSDFTNWEAKADGPHQIDFRMPFEALITLDRALMRAVGIQTAPLNTPLEPMVFEVADMIESVATRVDPSLLSRNGACFRELFHPIFGADRLLEHLQSLPDPWRERFQGEVKTVFSALKSTVLSSVWHTGAIVDETIQIPRSLHGDKCINESVDDFCAYLMRDLRNTYHGYMPKSPASRIRLLSTTGNITERITALPSLWLLAILAGGRRFFEGWKLS